MIKIDFDKTNGKIKCLHGINNGPLSNEAVVDTSFYYKDIGIPFVRLHDTDWPSFKLVDIPKIFPNFYSDPEDQTNYFFKETDQHLEAIVKTGAKILYRLGTSIEHTKDKRYVYPPKDNVQWAKICVGIIKHYNDGWADGYHFDIKYWEIWNEPENHQEMFVGGVAEDYYNLYVTSTKIIKEYDPSLKLGGYAAGYLPDGYRFIPPEGDTYFTGFLERIKKENAPFDFFSWHIYADAIKAIEHRAFYVKNTLDSYGFSDVEIFLDEWNFFDADWAKLMTPNGEFIRKSVFSKIKSQIGAAFAIAAIIKMQTLPIDAAFYYDGQPKIDWCGLFDLYGCPLKTYYALKAFGMLYKEQNSVESITSDDSIYSLATDHHVLLVNSFGKSDYYSVDLRNLKGNKIECYAIDAKNDYTLYRTEYCYSGRIVMKIYIEMDSVILLKITND